MSITHSNIFNSNIRIFISKYFCKGSRPLYRFGLFILRFKLYHVIPLISNNIHVCGLGYSQSEVQKMIPRSELRRINKRHLVEESTQSHKKPKIEKDDAETERQQKRANEINEKYVREHLNIDKSVQLVLSTLGKLPEAPPAQFKIDYAAFMKMGHVGEFKVLVKMLAIQLLEAGIGPGVDYLKSAAAAKEKEREKETVVADVVETIEADKGDNEDSREKVSS